MTDYKPIACQLYDHIEIVCMDSYHVVVSLHDGSTLAGQAITTENKSDGEYLILKTEDGNKAIRLDRLEKLDVVSENARFSTVSFT